MDPATKLEEQKPEYEEEEGGDYREFDSPSDEINEDPLDDNETQPMISHATEDTSSPIDHICKTKGTGMRDQQLNATKHTTLALSTSLLNKCVRERERLWVSRAAVVIGFVVFGFLGVDLLPSFLHSVRRHIEVLHGSSPPIPAPSPVICPLKLELLQKNRSRPQCPMDCVTKDKFYNGTWVRNPNKSRPEVLYMVDDVGHKEALFREGGLACRADVMLEYNQYDWMPSDPACEMADWAIPGVCRLLERTNVSSILFVGDSITFQNAQSFYKMAGGLHNLNQFDQTWRGNICGDILPRPIRLRYVRNDILYTGTRPGEWGRDYPGTTDGERRGVDRVYPWTHVLKEDEIDLLFVNTGAHVHDFTFYKLVIQRAVEYLKANYRGKLIFRTSVPGHSQCNDWFRPLESEEEIVPYNAEELSNFTWNYLERFNKYAAKMFESIGAEIAYPDRILKLRADGHLQQSDCLHYRLPGPPDWITKVWYNVWLTKYANLLDTRG